MIVYYRDRQVEITSEVLRLGDVAFRLVDLDYVWHTEGERDSKVKMRPFRRRAVGFALVMGSLLIVIGIIYLLALSIGQAATAGRVLLPLAAVVALIGFAGPLLEMALHSVDHSHDQGNQVHEIWAIIGGTERMLLRISNTSRFGKLYRALQRAIENHATPSD